MKIILFLALLFVIVQADIIIPQNIAGNLEGRIADTTGTPLSGVNISVMSENLQGIKGTISNDKGNFNIFFLPVGNYTVKISSVGYRKVIINDVNIRLGKTTYLNEIKLQQEAINLPEINISGKKQIIDPTITTYGGELQAKDFDQLPISRDYKDMVTLLPQANLSYFGDGANIGGATGFENKYFVDGVEVTDPLFGTNAMNLPYNFIQEVEVKAGGYEAEYLSSLGGVVNVVTYSGTNDFHGSAFGYFTNNNLTRNPRLGLLDPSQGDFSKYDFGFSLRGPVLKDAIWFNIAYNPIFNNHDVEIPGFGNYVDKTITHSFASKLTWSVSPKIQVILSADGDPFKEDGVEYANPTYSVTNPDPYLHNYTGGMYSISAKGIYTVSSDLVLNGSIARVIRHDTGNPATETGNGVFYYDDITHTQSGGTGNWYDSYRYNSIAKLSATHSFYTHILSAGIEYKVSGTDNRYFYNNIYHYYNSDFGNNVYEEDIGSGFQTVQQRIPSLFIQDNWKVFPKFRFNVGLRWDWQFVIGSNRRPAQTIDVPLQPRLGLIFLPRDDGSEKVYCSYGRYSQELNLGTRMAYSDQGYDSVFFYPQDPGISHGGEFVAPWSVHHSIAPEVENLQAQYYDEFSLGYERLIFNNFKVSVQGLYRTLGQAIDDGYIPSESRFGFGNPGKYPFYDRPKATRDYTALIISIERHGDEHFNFLASYVLSREYGNYEGLFDAFYHSTFPNQNYSFDNPFEQANISGLLPNDRTHVFKFFGSYRFLFGLSAGAYLIWASGTPLSEYMIGSYNSGIRFLTQRGTAGRTPSIWDLAFRFTYEMPQMNLFRPRLIVDLYDITGKQEPVDIDQLHYKAYDNEGNPINPNPTFGQALRYQPSMSMRLGMEINF